MNGLMVHSPDSGMVTKEQAFAIPVPEQTRTYTPISNESLWDMLQKTAESKGLILSEPQFGVAHKGQRLFGVADITNQDYLDEEVRLTLGLRNSYDKTLSVGVCFGSKVFVCDNMCFSGYASEDEDAVGQVHKRHHSDVFEGLQIRLEEAMSKFDVFRSYQESSFNRMKEMSLTDAAAHDLIIQSVRAEAITAKDCMTVANEWAFQSHCPENEWDAENWHKEFMPRNVWSLFNAFTEVHKGFQQKNPFGANVRSIKLNNFFHSQFLSN
jgi:hypothetical protein